MNKWWLVGLRLPPKFWIETMKWDIHLSNNVIQALSCITIALDSHWQWNFIWSIYLLKCKNLGVLHPMHWCMITLTTICIHVVWLHSYHQLQYNMVFWERHLNDYLRIINIMLCVKVLWSILLWMWIHQYWHRDYV